jgi:serine/threonine protein kinase
MDTETRLGGGRYVVRGLLGEGAQAVTYQASDPEGRLVAIKRFDVRGARSWKDVELAERETRVLASLDHPLVPRYIEHFEENGALFLVMEKVEGETLEAIRRREGPLSETEVRRFLACADRALTYLHGRASPVVHRDVKPRNVVRRPDGSYVFVDFGAVSERMARKGSSTIVGTMGYMAPEQLQGRALPATDVYAVGATALAALTGMEPEALPHKGLRVDVRAALQGRQVSPELVASLDRMLAPDPDERPTSLSSALDGIAANPVSVPPAANGNGAPVERRGRASDDGLVKSLRSLLWVLWGLGWVIVPLVLHQAHAEQDIPIVMFGSLAALLVLTWHKGALIRAVMNRWRAESSTLAREAPPRARIDAGIAANPSSKPQPAVQVRVHTSELSPQELVSETEVKVPEADARRRKL